MKTVKQLEEYAEALNETCQSEARIVAECITDALANSAGEPEKERVELVKASLRELRDIAYDGMKYIGGRS